MPEEVLFVGDSITCGYGVDDPVKEHHFKTSTEDATKTYAFKTAQALNADWSFVSVSGWGIISGYTGDAKKNANSVIPRVYDKLGFSWGNTIFGINPGNISWNFDSYQPDFVVINLGTNDATYTKKKADIKDIVQHIKYIRNLVGINSELKQQGEKMNNIQEKTTNMHGQVKNTENVMTKIEWRQKCAKIAGLIAIIVVKSYLILKTWVLFSS